MFKTHTSKRIYRAVNVVVLFFLLILSTNQFSSVSAGDDTRGDILNSVDFASEADAAPVFTDVPASHWAWNWIETLYWNGITVGCSTTPMLYCPEESVTRAQMAIFLERSIHGSTYQPPAVGTSTGFSDVPTTHWAATWIKQLAADGITTGCGGGNYCPEDSVTRAQMAVFLLRAKYGANYQPPTVGGSTGFYDVPITYWAAPWIKQLAAVGITTSCGGGNFCPEDLVTRAQMAKFLVITFHLPPPPSPQAEQARAFAEPILTAIAGYSPNFEDDFSTDKGWGPFGAPCPFGIEEGILRVELGAEGCAFTLEDLSRKDFVLQFDSRLVVGDMMSDFRVNYHHAIDKFIQLAINSKAQIWFVTVFKPEATTQTANGTGLVSLIGEFTQVRIIVRGPKSAIYINGTPVAYIEDIEFDTAGATWFSCQSFSQTTCELDNVKLWELAGIPGLP